MQVRTQLLPRWEAGGWKLTEAVEALWRGTTDEATLTRGIDRASATVVVLMLGSDDEASERPRFRALRPQSITRSDDPSSRGVGRLAPGDIVTGNHIHNNTHHSLSSSRDAEERLRVRAAVDGSRVVITPRPFRGRGGRAIVAAPQQIVAAPQQITRLRIGENRWVTEKSTNGPTLLELVPRISI